MANFLLDNQKTDIYYKDNDVIIYNPTEIQHEEIVKILQDNTKVGEDLSIEGDIPSSMVRYLIRELTNIGHEIDEMTDEEILSAIDNGNRRIKILFKELLNLVEEIGEDIQWAMEQQVKTINKLINIANSKESEDKVKAKIEKLMKKNGLDISLDELADIQNNPENINKLVNKIKAQPQDRKSKTKK